MTSHGTQLAAQMRLKALKLVFEGDSDHEAAVELPLGERVAVAWHLQLQRVARSLDPPSDLERLREGASVSLLECLDWDFQPPTDRQLRFADAIAKEFKLTLTDDVIRYRGAMSVFLDRFAGDFRERCAERFALGDRLTQ